MKLFKRIATTALAAVVLTLSTISTTSAADWKAAYREQLAYMNQHVSDYHSYDTFLNESDLEYTVYDIDKDGTKELIVKIGTCEADFEFLFYTYSNGKVISLGSKSGSHAGLSGCSGNGILIYSAHMGYEFENKVTKQGNKLYTTEVFSRYSENYHAPNYFMTLIKTTDYSYVPY